MFAVMVSETPRYTRLVDAGIILSTASSFLEFIGNIEGQGISCIDYAAGEQPRYLTIPQQALLGDRGREVRSEISDQFELFLVSLNYLSAGDIGEPLSAEVVDWFSAISTLKGLCFNNFSSLETLVRAPKKLRQLGELILGSMTLSKCHGAL